MKTKFGMSAAVFLIAAFVFSSAAVFSAVVPAADGGVRIVSDRQLVAEAGVLQGDENGLTAAYWEKETTRLQAAILFLRLKGLEQEALSFRGADNFADAGLVWPGGQAILAYLKTHPELGWIGVGGNRFDPLAAITGQQLYKVLLETLGYRQDVDFRYDEVQVFARSLGIGARVGQAKVRNKHLAGALVELLNAKPKGGTRTVGELLAAFDPSISAKLEAIPTTGIRVVDHGHGAMLTDEKGMTLYYFARDAADLDACKAACLQKWPVFYRENLYLPAELDPADVGVLVRPDGVKQITYRGWPLYYFADDKTAGDMKGEGVNGVWFVVQPDLSVRTAASASPSPSPSPSATPTPSPGGQTYVVEMKNFAFTPNALEIRAGDSVTFVNRDSVRHNAVATDGTTFRTPLLTQGESFTVRFDKSGVYEYLCEPHRSFMHGSITVK